jgi:hypothetical protein
MMTYNRLDENLKDGMSQKAGKASTPEPRNPARNSSRRIFSR